MKVLIIELCGSLLLLSLLGMFFRTFPSILKSLGVPEAVVAFFATPPEWVANVIAVFFVVGVAGVMSVLLAVGVACVLLAIQPKMINDIRKTAQGVGISVTVRGFMAVIGIIFIGRWVFTLIGWAAIAVVGSAMVAGYLYRTYQRVHSSSAASSSGEEKPENN